MSAIREFLAAPDEEFMGRSRRQIIAKHVYELCFRAREGIPFPPNDVINLILESAMARVQRDSKVELCHHFWMGNHAHMLIVAKDAGNVVKFYAELQKTLTDLLKRLLGIDFLHLWEGRPMVALIGDADKMVQRIAYFYANASRAHLVDSVEHYPGVSSYAAFKECFSKSIESYSSKTVAWIRPSKVKPLAMRSLSDAQAKNIVKELIREAKTKHQLICYPNAWMKCFGIKESEVESLNRQIDSRLRASESLSRQEREARGFKAMGIKQLKAEPILKPHKPQKRERKIFFLASTKEIRFALLEAFREFDARCRACFEAWSAGDVTVVWPPGAFRPPMGVLSNALC